MTAYFIDPVSGDDLATGESGAPWKTPMRAVYGPKGGFLAGDTLTSVNDTVTAPIEGGFACRSGSTQALDGLNNVTLTANYIRVATDVSVGASSEVSADDSGIWSAYNLWFQSWNSATDADSWTENLGTGGAITQNSTDNLCGAYCLNITNGAADSRITRANMPFMAVPTKLKIIYKTSAGDTGQLELKNTAAVPAVWWNNDSQVWQETVFKMTLPASETWTSVTTEAFTTANNNGFHQLQIYCNGASSVLDIQAIIPIIEPSWTESAGVYSCVMPSAKAAYNSTLKQYGVGLWVGDTTNVEDLTVSPAATTLSALAAGEHFWDATTFKVHYMPETGKTFADLKLYVSLQDYGIHIAAGDSATVNDAYICCAGGYGIANSGTLVTSNVNCAKSWLYGAQDAAGSTATYYDCIFEYNNDTNSENGANGHLTLGTSSLYRCVSRYNGDDGFQVNHASGVLVLQSCEAYSNLAAQLSLNIASSVTVTNCTFADTYHKSYYDIGSKCISDISASGTTRVFKNNIVDRRSRTYEGQSVSCLYPTGATESHNLLYGNGTKAAPWGVTSGLTTDPLFVDLNGGDLRLAPGSPAYHSGVTMGHNIRDVNGRPFNRGGAPSRGAEERTSGVRETTVTARTSVGART